MLTYTRMAVLNFTDVLLQLQKHEKKKKYEISVKQKVTDTYRVKGI